MFKSMNNNSWFAQISFKQRIWLFATVAGMLTITVLGILLSPSSKPKKLIDFNINMSIRGIAPKLGVTGKGLARELELPIDISKKKPLNLLNVTDEELHHAVEHILSHRDSILKYYIYAALVLFGLVFLTKLGRPDGSDVKRRHKWYPRAPYIASLLLSVIVAGFLLGKSPNPMEGTVKVFKSMVGLYPDPMVKVIAFSFFIMLAVIGNKIICGWACPFGALQELIYSIPILQKIKKKKLPFVFTNTIRVCLFIAMFLFLFGIIGGRRGFVIYHNVNPFNLFDFDYETFSILLTVIIALLVSVTIYRPFCQFICPFGLVSWIAERVSIFHVRIDKEKCTQCGACIKACPLEAAKGKVAGNRLPADCFSCARCLNVCPVDALRYTSIFKKGMIKKSK
ncbi:MAG: 4Fe-4S binding protein [Candidatus Omnitrophota bacterium]|nr:4Fe-4S binding protein [Candidatus Omnitrophota bacterium]